MGSLPQGLVKGNGTVACLVPRGEQGHGKVSSDQMRWETNIKPVSFLEQPCAPATTQAEVDNNWEECLTVATPSTLKLLRTKGHEPNR